MRHLWSLLAGILIAPLAWLGVAAGQSGSEQAVAEWQQAGRFDTADLIGPAAFLVAVGVLLGLVGTLRLSPAGPLAAGLLLVAPTVFMFINPFEALDAFAYDETSRVLGQDMQLWRPVQNGTLLVLGALLLMAVFSSSRWRRPEPGPLLAAGAPELAGAAEATGPEPATALSDEETVTAAAAVDEPEAQPESEAEPVSAGVDADAGAGEERPTAEQPSAAAAAKPAAAADSGTDSGTPAKDSSDPDDPDDPDEAAGAGASGSKAGGSGGAAS